MKRAVHNIIILLSVCTAASYAAAGSFSVPVAIEEYEIRLEDGLVTVSTPEGFDFSSAGKPALPWKHIFLPADDLVDIEKPRLVILEADTIELAAPLSPTAVPVQTRDSDSRLSDYSAGPVDYPAAAYPEENCRIESRTIWQGRPVLSISWCPFRYFPESNLLEVIRRAKIRVSDSQDTISSAKLTTGTSTKEGYEDVLRLLHNNEPVTLARAASTEESRSIQTGTPTEVDYLIVTDESLVSALRPLAEWRLKQGYRVGIADINEITASYPGEDIPAQIRAYLSQAYTDGLQFCLLGGDETIVPIRYAYHGYADTMPSYSKMQICDLYYADFTGEWDNDGDGIYGEYEQDNPDIYPEIYLGRLLTGDASQAEIIVNKIINYETNPGDGDPSYLTRALFTCADQMRDWNDGQGQHAIIGANFPEYYDLDLESQSENPNGSLPDPQTPEGTGFVEQAGLGWGWTTLANHGRADGFVLRSAGINQWPKSYVWTVGSDGDGHGHLNLLSEDGPPGIVLSLACDVGGFDMDGPLFGGFYANNVSEMLTQKPNGGAVAVVAYSRWGWVASSYRILSKFAEYAFDPSVAPQLGAAFSLAKTNFPYYRDQNFGLNLYGDPAMPHWTDVPQTIQADYPAEAAVGSGAVEFTVTHEGFGLAGAVITAAYGDTVFFTGETDENGTAVWQSGPDRLGGYDITITKPGFLPHTAKLIVPIVAGITDEENQSSALPFALAQNHPNPFNPTTTIQFDIPATGPVCLEVYDILGRRVTTLIEEVLGAGGHSVRFDGNDQYGTPLSSGVYFYRLQAGTFTELKKMVLLK